MSEDRTGGAEPRVDCAEVSAALADLTGVPVEQHILTYQTLHDRLAGALADVPDGGLAGPDGSEPPQR